MVYCFSDVRLGDGQLICRIRKSKTGQLGKAATVVLYKLLGSEMWPVQGLSAARPNGPVSLLIHGDGSFLSR